MSTAYIIRVKLGHNEAQQNTSLPFGSSIAYIKTIQRWFQKFCLGNKSLENGPKERPNLVIKIGSIKCSG